MTNARSTWMLERMMLIREFEERLKQLVDAGYRSEPCTCTPVKKLSQLARARHCARTTGLLRHIIGCDCSCAERKVCRGKLVFSLGLVRPPLFAGLEARYERFWRLRDVVESYSNNILVGLGQESRGFGTRGRFGFVCRTARKTGQASISMEMPVTLERRVALLPR